MSNERIALGPEVWQKVFNWRIYQNTSTLFKQIFKRPFGFAGLKAMGITVEDLNRIRGPLKKPPFFLPFCRLINETKEGRQRCAAEEKESLARLSTTDQIDIFTCHAGLTEIAVPITFRGKYHGCLSIPDGGLLLHEPNEVHFQQIAERVKDTGVDLERLRKAYFAITPISEKLLKVMLTLMESVTEEIIKAAVEAEEDKKRIAELESALYEKYNFTRILGKSQAMQGVFSLLRRIIETDSTVLIEGETGTGKELIASTIHYNSPRKNKPLNAVNCGGFTETLLESELFGYVKGSFTGASSDKKGIFEVTDRGTIFLDEVAEMSPALQVKLLRILQEGTFSPVGSTQIRKVDVRIISATNKNLKELVAQGKFREDLYYRLNVLKVSLPPLRERKEDIPLLIDHFIKRISSAKTQKIVGIKPNALKILLDYHWPGNIRELQNILERAIALADSKYISREDLPEDIINKEKNVAPPINFEQPFEQIKKTYIMPFEREYLIKMLIQTKGNVTTAAKQAGLSRAGLQKLIKKHHIRPSDYKA